MIHFARAVAIGSLLLFSQVSQSQNDCANAIVVCGNTGFAGLNATGVGMQELGSNHTCGSQENNTIWLKLPIKTSGTLSFVLTPESTDLIEDFDFFIFGPNVTCNSLGMAVRCSTTNPLMSGQLDNLTGMNNAEIDVSEGPGELGNGYIQEMTVTAGDVYYMAVDRPFGVSNFSIQWSGTATFESQPQMATLPHNLQTCVPTGNTGLFNLNENYNPIMGGQPNLLLTFHTSSNDAITGENFIIAPTIFQNTGNPQTIYARLTNPISGCFTMADFELSITNGPFVPNDTVTICDDGADGSVVNAQSFFDLDVVTQTIMPGQNMTGLTVSYFSTALDAQQNLVPPLPVHFYNTTPNLQNVYVRVSNTTGCVLAKEIHLRVNPQPGVVHATLSQCDIGLVPDGVTLFDLNNAIPALTGGNTALNVAFFETGNPAPLGLQYTNLTNPQTLNARITNTISGCESISTVTLVVNTSPPPIVTIAPQCDILGIENGIIQFDLTSANVTLSPTQTVSFYQNPNDALLGQNQIANVTNYTNATAYNDVVYVRIEDSGNCVSISTLALVVNKLPNVERTTTGLFVCNDHPDYFITIDAAILEGTPPDYTYNWFHDAIAMGETGYSISINEAGIYTVEVMRLGCTITRMITVQQSANANIESVVVDDFITDYNTVAVNVHGSSPGDYVFSLNQPTGPFQASNFFMDVAPGIHELYIKDLLACGVFGPIQVNVLGIPKYFTPNGDGFNDTWNINGADAQHSGKAIIYIFDRYGKLLKQISPLGLGWDGNYIGKPAPAEDYWYTIELEDTRKSKGHFTLKR